MRFSLRADAINFLLNGQLFEARDRQAEKQVDSTIKNHICVPESPFDLRRRAFNCCRIGYAPMTSDGLSRPDRTGFARSVVADGKYKIQLRRAGFRELVPTFATQACCR